MAAAFITTFSHLPAIFTGDVAVVKMLPLYLATAMRAKLSDLP